MTKIRMLPLHEAQKIAAGEVVERPASVVKELLENALDAGATRISLSVYDGGKKRIRITDNGCGMSVEDARLCIQKHATSKITCIADLDLINTFGFRGEALAALAAVSHMTLITKEVDTHEAVKLTVADGVIIKQETVAAQTGTTIDIEDLFYNVPARQKFLKKRETEFRAIQQLFFAMSLAYPHVHMQLYSQDVLVVQYASATQKERYAQVLTNAPHQALIPLAESDRDVVITGVVSDHQWFRYDRSHIFLFVNKRWVKNQSLSRALMRGYGNVLPSDRFPVACVMVEVPASEVDVNVHPRKEEVQFVHPHRVEQLIATSIKKTFEAVLSQRIAMPMSSMLSSSFGDGRSTMAFAFAAQHEQYEPTIPPLHAMPFLQEAQEKQVSDVIPYTNMPVPQDFKVGPAPSPTESAEFFAQSETSQVHQEYDMHIPMQEIATVQTHVEMQKQYAIIGQLHNTYIIVQMEDGVVLVDQHAAHERILYEQFASRFIDGATVHLLFPELISLTSADLQTVQPYIEMLHEHGVIIEVFGETQLRVIATPVHLKHTSIAELVQYVIGIINEQERMGSEDCMRIIQHKLRAQMACKAAVKAGDMLNERRMQELLTDLYKTENCLTCPHGRPTYWHISHYEIEKKFKRVG